ncbi:MAG: histidine phosphatase family protein [Anaerolineales bacterium]|nr:histidine phosphatase family protein [Anaerolineales bacterium]
MTARILCRIILVRHGQTEWNRIERFRGQADISLNEFGFQQAAATAVRIAREWQPSGVYSSPLSRAVKTAEAVAHHFNLPVQICPGLNDINYGKWQGLTPDEVMQQWPQEYHAWIHAPHTARIPGGESLDHLRQRVMDTVHQLAQRHLDETIVLVGHTVINRVILLGVLVHCPG